MKNLSIFIVRHSTACRSSRKTSRSSSSAVGSSSSSGGTVEDWLSSFLNTTVKVGMGGFGGIRQANVERVGLGISSQKLGVMEKGAGDAVGGGVAGWGLL